MCVFRGAKQEVVKGLLPKKESFPIPVQEEFGGDVLIGWKKMSLSAGGDLRSAIQRTLWLPGVPMCSKVQPNRDSGEGIYAYHDNIWDKSYYLGPIVKVAMWGKALDFEWDYPGIPSGIMAQFAYPLEIYLRRDYLMPTPTLKEWKDTGVYVFVGGKRV